MVVPGHEIAFDLVAVDGKFVVSENDWTAIRYWLLELQPVSRVRLVGDPPDRIRVWSYGDSVEVAPGLLARVAALVGTPLRVQSVGARSAPDPAEPT
jgi:hypothetical protein